MAHILHQSIVNLTPSLEGPPTSARAPTSRLVKTKASSASHCPSGSIGIVSVAFPPMTDIKGHLPVSNLPFRGQTHQQTVGAPIRRPLSGSSPIRAGRPRPSSTSRPQPSTTPNRISDPQKRHSSKVRYNIETPGHALTGHSCAITAAAEALTGCEKRVLQIGIETEFYLAACHPDNEKAMLVDFVRNVANNHNDKVHKRHRRMQKHIRRYNFRGKYDKWCLVEDPSISGSKCEPWGLELVSPIFRASVGSGWRQDVEATWKCLNEHYRITTTDRCSTHIHISLDPFFTTQEIKRIAQAAIHFEAAFEALVPPVRRNNDYVKSNWLDSPYLEKFDRSRSSLIEAIEKQVKCEDLTRLMQHGGDRDYAWNFWALFSKRTVEFRKPPASTTAEEVLGWAELAMSFVQASVKCECLEKLQSIPATIGGLRWFVSQFLDPGVNEPGRMHGIWLGKDPKEMLEPIPNPTGYWHYEGTKRRDAMMRLKNLAAADERNNQYLVEKVRDQYW